MKNTMKAIAALIISATMISITACGNTDTTSSAPPKATTTASSTEASATTTTEATLTSQSEETTSLSATTTGTSASTKSTSSSKSSTAPKNTAKANSSKASNGGTVNNNNQSYSHSTSNNGSGNNSYSNDNNNSYQPQQTERQTERQTTTTAKKTQAPKPKPTTTTTAKPKVNLTQSDIDRLQKELQAYSNELARPRVEKIYTNGGYSSADEYMADLADVNLNTASWTSGDNIYAHEKYNDVLQSLKEEIQDEYNFYSEEYLHQSVIIIQAGTDYYGHSCWNTYLLRA